MSAHPSRSNGGQAKSGIVIVGASLAGLRAAEAARLAGHAGPLTIVGAEAHPPYDRPPLSKHVLTGKIAPNATELPCAVPLHAEWRLGMQAVGLDRASRQVHLADGTRLAYSRLLVATGARARTWKIPEEGRLTGVFTIRSRDDAAALRRALAGRPQRVLVIGSGFIGCEVAAACRNLDLPVTVLDPAPTPLAGVLGTHLGAVVAALHAARGTEMRNGTGVERLVGEDGRLVRAELTDGSSIEADVAVVALGVVRNTDWLQGSGLSADEGGLDCDEHGRALDCDGRIDEAVFAAGDVARFPHPLYDGRRVALEHWSHAQAQGEHVGRLLANGEPGAPYRALPSFWSAQGGINIKSIGLTEGADGLVIAQGDPRSGRFVAVYGRKGRCIAAVSIDSARWLPVYAEAIEARAPFPPIHGASDQPKRLDILQPGFPKRSTS